jgi:hypothetical protein
MKNPIACHSLNCVKSLRKRGGGHAEGGIRRNKVLVEGRERCGQREGRERAERGESVNRENIESGQREGREGGQREEREIGTEGENEQGEERG